MQDTSQDRTATKAPERAPVMGAMHERARAVALDDPAEQLLLELLAGYQDADVTPAVVTLAALLGVEPRDVDALLDRLSERGLIKVYWAGPRWNRPGYRLGKPGRRNYYWVLLGEER